jgi:hypothetical protein
MAVRKWPLALRFYLLQPDWDPARISHQLVGGVTAYQGYNGTAIVVTNCAPAFLLQVANSMHAKS